MQAAVNVYFQARYGQAAQEGAAEASEFKQFSGICATLMRTAPHYGGSLLYACLLYTSPSPRDRQKSRMPSSA